MSKSMIVVALLLAGCSSAAPSAPTPLVCHRTDRHGTYMADFTQQSGTCGPLTTRLLDLDDAPPPAGCTVAQMWSENDCKVVGVVRCSATYNAPASDLTAVTHQDTQDGSVLSGTQTLTIEGGGGCVSTYAVHMVRQ